MLLLKDAQSYLFEPKDKDGLRQIWNLMQPLKQQNGYQAFVLNEEHGVPIFGMYARMVEITDELVSDNLSQSDRAYYILDI